MKSLKQASKLESKKPKQESEEEKKPIEAGGCGDCVRRPENRVEWIRMNEVSE